MLFRLGCSESKTNIVTLPLIKYTFFVLSLSWGFKIFVIFMFLDTASELPISVFQIVNQLILRCDGGCRARLIWMISGARELEKLKEKTRSTERNKLNARNESSGVTVGTYRPYLINVDQ